MVYTYIVTIRKSQVKDYVSYDDLKKRVAGLCLCLPSLNVIIQGYEAHGLYRQLHVHLLVYSPKRISYRLINGKFKGDGYIYHFKRCNIGDHEDIESCCKYITKNDSNMYEREQTLIENYYNYHYGF